MLDEDIRRDAWLVMRGAGNLHAPRATLHASRLPSDDLRVLVSVANGASRFIPGTVGVAAGLLPAARQIVLDFLIPRPAAVKECGLVSVLVGRLIMLVGTIGLGVRTR